jgi:hypothetical protein
MTKPQDSLLRQGAWVVIRNEQAYTQYSYIGFKGNLNGIENTTSVGWILQIA